MVEIRLKNKKGFTLIEALVFLFIFTVTVTTFYSVLTLGLRYIQESKNKLGALAMANEKMEIARNLKYTDIGITTGIPSGSILEDETITANTKAYKIHTEIQFIDDPFDGVAPADLVPNDYKRVKVIVSWSGASGASSQVSLVSRFVPPGLEVASGDGILSINVIDGTGNGVPQAQVHIVNNALTPKVDITQNVDNTGNLMFPGAKQSLQQYAITVLKNGYETVATVAPGSVAYNAIDVHASVITGLLNTKSVVIDKLADLKIKAADYLGNAIPSVAFHLQGGRILGTNNAIPPQTEYILNADETTNVSGEFNLNNYGPGQFFITSIGAVPGYTLIGVDPLSNFIATPMNYKVTLLPSENKTVNMKFADDSKDSLLVKVVRDSDNSPISDARVVLSNGSGYSVTVITSVDGVAFFPTDANPFAAGAYTLDVTSSGFQDYTGSVNVNKLTTQEVKLIT